MASNNILSRSHVVRDNGTLVGGNFVHKFVTIHCRDDASAMMMMIRTKMAFFRNGKRMEKMKNFFR